MGREAEMAVLDVGAVPGVGEQSALVADAAGWADPRERLQHWRLDIEPYDAA